ncbi:MAG: VWA domain-containing protein [Verrucomicrobia bacterium]|nr:VWA domain-containing protein [Verrucomicrobiota bacterium]
MLNSPEWLLLIPALAFAGWRWRSLGMQRPRRFLCLLGIVALLVEPRIASRRGGMDLWVLLDRSASTEDLVDRNEAEWRTLLERARPSRRDTLHVLDYAAEVLPAEAGGVTSLYGNRRGQTRTALALSHVLAAQEAGRPARVLVFTDGYATEPLRESAAKLAAEGLALDYRLIQPPVADDVRIASLELPSRVQLGESFVLRLAVVGTGNRTVPLNLRRDGQAAGNSTVTLREGRGSVEIVDHLGQPGAHRYEAEILPEHDSHPGNNRASRWVEVVGGPRVLLVTRFPDDPLAEAFRAQGLTVEVVTDPQAADEGRLTGARAVVIHNVPAFDLRPEFLRAFDFFVREQGGGFLMVGGKHAFGSGGYFQSAIDPLLPVSMELKNDHRKLVVAMAIALDRSGSMAAAVPGPAGQQITKMDMAAAGSATAVELLGPSDFVSVHAVDSEPYAIVPMGPVGNRKADMVGRIRRIRSMGGGIFIYKALEAAWQDLQGMEVGTRHIILFADAADSEEPGDYRQLLPQITKAGGTVSVIGMGTRKDKDAALLEEIARLGNGRIQFTDQAAEIPQLFAQETMTVARKSFIEEPIATQATGNWAELSPQPIDWLGEVDGYNLSYARPEATVSLASKDEYVAPLVATMRRGIGRAAAVTFPLGGEFSGRARQWPGYADFTKTLSRWLAGGEIPAGLGLAQRLDGNRLTIDLHYSTEAWTQRLAISPPRLKLSIGAERPQGLEVPWQRLAPGHFSAAVELEENASVRGVVQAGDYAFPFGPINVGVSAEWAFDPERLQELRVVAAQSGGRELLDLSQAWLRPPVRQVLDLRLPLVILILLAVLADALATRMGLEPRLATGLAWARTLRRGVAVIARSKHARWPRMLPRKPRPQVAPVAAADQPPDLSQPPLPADDDARRRRRFDHAKRGK